MIIDVWRPIYKSFKGDKQITHYELYHLDVLLGEKKQGYKVRYTCDVCKSPKLCITRSGVLMKTKKSLNNIEKQTCRSCRSRISEYEIKKNYIDYNTLKKSIESSNYELLTDEKKYLESSNKSQLKLDVICQRGHMTNTTWNNWDKGKRCMLCYKQSKFENAVKYKFGWQRYKFLVRYYSELSFKKHYVEINPNEYERGKDYHLDHKYSIYEGFLNNISPKLVGHYQNLEVISSNENLKKNKKCSITINELKKI